MRTTMRPAGEVGSRRRRATAICAPLLLCLVSIWVAYTSVLLYQNQDDLRHWMNSAVRWKLSTHPTNIDNHEAALKEIAAQLNGDAMTLFSTQTENFPNNERENFPNKQTENFPVSDVRSDNSEDEVPYIPFGSLRLCSKDTGLFYSCENDPTCLSPTCLSRNRTFVFTDPDNWRRFYDGVVDRRRLLSKILERMMGARLQDQEKRVMLMAFNSGFAHLFGNWYCGLLANLPQVQVDRIKRELLVLATDEDAISYVRALGFFTPSTQEVDALMEWTRQGNVQQMPSAGFGMGSHGLLNLVLKIAMPVDLIDMNYTVLIQDVDVVWTQNVLDEIDHYCNSATCDAVFIQESRDFIAKRELERTKSWRRNRTDLDHPGYKEANTGLFLLRPKRAVRSLLRSLIEGNRLQQWKSRDQLLWNSLLHHKAFQDSTNFSFNLLPKTRFVPGKYLRRQHLANWTMPSVPELVALHASDTSSFKDKYKRLKSLGHWYFDEATCPGPVRTCMQMRETCYAPVEDSITEYRKFLVRT